MLVKAVPLFAVYGQTSLVAGEGAYYGDNSTYLDATFNGPMDIVIDPATGNKYIADTYNNVIREISASGIVTTLAGNAAAGYAEGIGAAASFNNPYAICLDSQDGIIFVADTINSRIRGIYLSNSQTFLVAGLSNSGASDGANTVNARFYSPMGIAYDGSGPVHYIYVSDSYNYKIRRIDLTANTTTTIAGASYGYKEGTGAGALFNAPRGIDIDTVNQILYIADTGNNRIRGLNLSTKASFYVAGGSAGWQDGNSTTAMFSAPADVSLNTINAELYVADQNNYDIRAVNLAAGTVATLAGNHLASGYKEATGTAALFNKPQGNAYNYIDNKIYVADTGNSRIRTIDPANNSQTALFSGMSSYGGDGNMAPNATFYAPNDVALNTVTSRKYIADTGNSAIRMIDEGSMISTIAGNGSAGYAEGLGTSAVFSSPQGLAVDSIRNLLYISDSGNHAIRKLDLSTYQTSLVAGSPGVSGYADGIGSNAKFYNPGGIDIDAQNNILYVADTGNQVIREINLNTDQTSFIAGHMTTTASYAEGTGASAYFHSPYGVLYYGTYNILFVTDTGNDVVRYIELGTQQTVLLSGTPQTPGDVLVPTGGGMLSAKFKNPTGLALDYNAQLLYVSDSGNEKVKAIDLAGNGVYEVSGSSTAGYAEGIGTAALFTSPYGMGIDVNNQAVYIADSGNSRIRKIDVTMPTPTVTITQTGTITLTPTISPTMNGTATVTPTLTTFLSATITPTYSQSFTQTQTFTITETLTISPTDTATQTGTNTGTATPTMTITQTPTISPTDTTTATNTVTSTETPTYTITETITSSPTYTYTCTYTETMTCTETPTISQTPTPSPYVSNTPTYTISETLTQSATFTETMTFTDTQTATATGTVSLTTTITETLTATAPETATPTATASLYLTSFTPTPALTITATSTPVEYIELDPNFIKGQIVIPNPSSGNFRIRFTTTQQAKTINVKIYTSGFRLIRMQQYIDVITGIHDMQIEDMNNAASGWYYYSIDGESDYGDKTLVYGGFIIIK